MASEHRIPRASSSFPVTFCLFLMMHPQKTQGRIGVTRLPRPVNGCGLCGSLAGGAVLPLGVDDTSQAQAGEGREYGEEQSAVITGSGVAVGLLSGVGFFGSIGL